MEVILRRVVVCLIENICTSIYTRPNKKHPPSKMVNIKYIDMNMIGYIHRPLFGKTVKRN